jgi:Icc protein
VTGLPVCHHEITGSARERAADDTWLPHPVGMRDSTLAHVSDLHLGRSERNDTAATELVRTLARMDPDHVVVSGDVTHRGRHDELARFEQLFAAWRARGVLTVVPGNHDRVGQDAGSGLMGGERVRVDSRPGLWVVSVDSTGPHNRSYINSHGALCRHVLEQVDEALGAAPEDALVAVTLHHHVLPLPEESFAERLASFVGLPHANELELGDALLRRVHGRCDLVLHGHRHVPRAFHFDLGLRRLSVYNAGSSSELGRFRLFTHRNGALLERPRWVRCPGATQPRPSAQPVPSMA